MMLTMARPRSYEFDDVVEAAEVRLDDFRPRREPEKIRIAFTESAFALVCLRFALGHH